MNPDFFIPVVTKRAHVLLRYLCLFANNGVQYKLCCVYVLRLLYPMLPVSLDCPLLITPSVFFNVYV